MLKCGWMDRQRFQAWLLRLSGSVEILAFLAVVMPRSWMETAHTWLGMGEMPSGPVVMFMIRQASFTYGMHGISLWVIASDVERFRLLVLLNAIAYLVAGPIFFLIDYNAGMPGWWAVGDLFACASFGGLLLWLSRSSGLKSV